MLFLLACSGLALGLAAAAAPAPPQTADLAGHWHIVASLSPMEERTLHFEARPGGRGSLQLRDAASDLVPPAEPSPARWARGAGAAVTFSGEVAFPIGNVGREPGTLVFRGALESADSITGSVAFFRAGQDPSDPGAVPARAGTFTARRVTSQPGD